MQNRGASSAVPDRLPRRNELLSLFEDLGNVTSPQYQELNIKLFLRRICTIKPLKSLSFFKYVSRLACFAFHSLDADKLFQFSDRVRNLSMVSLPSFIFSSEHIIYFCFSFFDTAIAHFLKKKSTILFEVLSVLQPFLTFCLILLSKLKMKYMSAP